jgi:D-glycerate 3-kinase
LYGLIDVQLLLQGEGMHKVYEWRRLQERKLAAKAAEAESGATALRTMSEAEVDRFIMHYERLTRHILAEMPERADVVLPIDDTHNPASVRINRPTG